MSAHEGERLAKRIAAAGRCSRRDAEKWIAAGRVAVNGERITTPARNVTDDDLITIDGEPLEAPTRTRVWLYHKPTGLVTTHKDPEGRPTVFSALPGSLPRVISVGRLDVNSEGLLLLTTSGALARELELPANGWKRRYRVRVRGAITPLMVERLARGQQVEGVKYGPVKVAPERSSTGRNQWAEVTLEEGKNREIRKLFAHFGCQVSRLIRVAYGPFELGTLAPGAVREVPAAVLKKLLERF